MGPQKSIWTNYNVFRSIRISGLTVFLGYVLGLLNQHASHSRLIFDPIYGIPSIIDTIHLSVSHPKCPNLEFQSSLSTGINS